MMNLDTTNTKTKGPACMCQYQKTSFATANTANIIIQLTARTLKVIGVDGRKFDKRNFREKSLLNSKNSQLIAFFDFRGRTRFENI